MADDQNHTDTQQVDPNGDTAHVDWEAKYNEMKQHSREWERKAKANKVFVLFFDNLFLYFIL